MNFKDTIFLPETDFQMRGNLSQKEPELLEYWENLGMYDKCRSISIGLPKFILHDGPPFANGTPHAGTAMNKVLKDIVVRMKQMQGFDAAFVPGWDCHGLPIEWKIEEKLKEKGVNKDDISVAEFRNMCKEFAEHWIDVQRNGFKRLGVNGDWANPYLTMSFKAESTVIRLVGKFIMDGALYRGERPVFWSVVEKTALADAEIEYMDKKSTSIYLAFKVKSTTVDFLRDAFCVIWTTTPWTIPGNRAICYLKDTTYCLLAAGDGKYVVAKDLVESFSSTTGIECETLKEFPGECLKDVICRHPLWESGYDFDVPLLAAEHVETDSGTGLVHTAPGHGVEDFYVCKKHGVKVPQTVDGGGVYYDHVPLFAGKHVFKVEPELLQALDGVGALLFKSVITHSYPHSWRSKAPLIFRATPQWFISMDNTGLRKKALEEIEKVNWIPKQGYNRIKSFIENRGDWCLSRQRVWGVPLPLFLNKITGEPLKDADVINRVADTFEKEGSNAWFSRDSAYFLGDKYNPDDYEKMTDTMDVWFESASTHAYVLRDGKPEIRLVADLYLEGSDQHRGWFQHSLLNSCGAFGNSPYKAVLTHGFIVDEKGRKMSKSLGNTITLDEVVQNWGADIFRMWVSGSDYTQDLKLGINILKQLEDVYRKLRNTLRYMLGALSGYDEKTETVEYADMPDLEKWVLHRLHVLETELDQCINAYDINKYFTILHTFCSGDLSSFFFDIRKDCLYCDHKDDPKRKAYRHVLYVLFQHLVRRLAPIIVYTAEEAFKSFGSDGSIHLERFLKPDDKWLNPELYAQINKVKEIRRSVTTAIEIARKDKLLGSSLQASVSVFDPNRISPTNCKDFWEEITITSEVKLHNAPIPEGAFISDEIKNIGVVVSLANGEKCERCWKVSTSLNGDKICPRCQSVLAR